MPRRSTANRKPARPSMPRPAGPRVAYPSDLTDPQWALIEPFMPPETGAGSASHHRPSRRSSTPSSTCSTRAATGSPCPTTSRRPARSAITSINGRATAPCGGFTMPCGTGRGSRRSATPSPPPLRSIRSRSRPPRPAARRGSTRARSSRAASGTSWWTGWGCCWPWWSTRRGSKPRRAELVLKDVEKSYPNLKVVWADGGYQRDCLLKWVKERGVGWRLEVVQRPPGTKGFTVQSERWMVERTFAWLGRCRRLSMTNA